MTHKNLIIWAEHAHNSANGLVKGDQAFRWVGDASPPAPLTEVGSLPAPSVEVGEQPKQTKARRKARRASGGGKTLEGRSPDVRFPNKASSPEARSTPTPLPAPILPHSGHSSRALSQALSPPPSSPQLPLPADAPGPFDSDPSSPDPSSPDPIGPEILGEYFTESDTQLFQEPPQTVLTESGILTLALPHDEDENFATVCESIRCLTQCDI